MRHSFSGKSVFDSKYKFRLILGYKWLFCLVSLPHLRPLPISSAVIRYVVLLHNTILSCITSLLYKIFFIVDTFNVVCVLRRVFFMAILLFGLDIAVLCLQSSIVSDSITLGVQRLYVYKCLIKN